MTSCVCSVASHTTYFAYQGGFLEEDCERLCSTMLSCVYYASDTTTCHLCVAPASSDVTTAGDSASMSTLPDNVTINVKDGVQYDIFSTQDCVNLHGTSGYTASYSAQKISRIEICYSTFFHVHTGIRLYDESSMLMTSNGACINYEDASRVITYDFDEDEIILRMESYITNEYGYWLWTDVKIDTNKAMYGPIVSQTAEGYVDLDFNMLGATLGAGYGVDRFGATFERC